MRAFIRAELLSRNRMVGGLAAGAFTLLTIVALAYRSIGLQALGKAFPDKLPSGITALSGSRSGNWLTPHGWMGFGFNHPLFLVLTLTVAISIGSAAIAGEVDTGRAELLFSGAVPRTRFLAATIAIWLGAEVAVLLGGLAGGLLGGALSSDIRHAGLGALVWAPLQELPLTAFVAACSFLASAAASARGRAMGLAVGITVGAYLLNVISGLIGALDWVRWLTPFGYYDPGAAIAGGPSLRDAAVLLAGAAILLVAARALLVRRDLA